MDKLRLAKEELLLDRRCSSGNPLFRCEWPEPVKIESNPKGVFNFILKLPIKEGHRFHLWRAIPQEVEDKTFRDEFQIAPHFVRAEFYFSRIC